MLNPVKLTLIDPSEAGGLGRAIHVDAAQVLALVNVERMANVPPAARTQLICRGGTAFLLLEAAPDVAARLKAALAPPSLAAAV